MTRPVDDISPPHLARLSVESFIRTGHIIEPPSSPKGILAEQAGAFVTLRKLDGSLRGCIGTIVPQRPSVAEEIIENAIGAACRDYRFPQLIAHELTTILYGVDVLSDPEPVRGPEDLDPSRYGVIIGSIDGSRRGILLPGIGGIETVQDQWEVVHAKAGITLGTQVRIQRFTVTRFGEH